MNPAVASVIPMLLSDRSRGGVGTAVAGVTAKNARAASLRAGALAVSNLPPRLLFRGPSTRTKMRHTQSLHKSEQRRRLFSGTFRPLTNARPWEKGSSAHDHRPD